MLESEADGLLELLLLLLGLVEFEFEVDDESVWEEVLSPLPYPAPDDWVEPAPLLCAKAPAVNVRRAAAKTGDNDRRVRDEIRLWFFMVRQT